MENKFVGFVELKNMKSEKKSESSYWEEVNCGRGAKKLLLIGQHVIKKARNNVEYHSIKSLGGGKGRNLRKKC